MRMKHCLKLNTLEKSFSPKGLIFLSPRVEFYLTKVYQMCEAVANEMFRVTHKINFKPKTYRKKNKVNI